MPDSKTGHQIPDTKGGPSPMLGWQIYLVGFNKHLQKVLIKGPRISFENQLSQVNLRPLTNLPDRKNKKKTTDFKGGPKPNGGMINRLGREETCTQTF